GRSTGGVGASRGAFAAGTRCRPLRCGTDIVARPRSSPPTRESPMSAPTSLVFRSMHPRWLSNTWLVADRPGGHAVVIDTGGPLEPVCARIAELEVTPTHVLCTHHHHDHVTHNADYRARYSVPVCGHPRERELFRDLDVELDAGAEIQSGDLRIRAMHVPGHTCGQLAFLVDGREVFTGDTLFRGSVGGT